MYTLYLVYHLHEATFILITNNGMFIY